MTLTHVYEQPAQRDCPHLRLTINGETLRLVRDRLEVLTFDLYGRLLSAAMLGSVFRRGLDGRILKIDRVPGNIRFHDVSRLQAHEVETFHQQVLERLLQAKSLLGEKFVPLAPALKLDRHHDERRFQQTYPGSVGILPPDRYRALVVNLTEGCSYNRCKFCDFYKDRPFRIKAPLEFKNHIHQAIQAFDAALPYRRGLFLGQANAASLPTHTLLEALAILQDIFPAPLTDDKGKRRHPLGFESVAAFLDHFTRPTRSVAEWTQLRDLGLTRLYLGVESGSKEVLNLLGKPGSPRYIRQLVKHLKQADISLGVIVLSGAGGHPLHSAHVKGTVELLNSLPLDSSDTIFISELQVRSDYATLNLDHLSREECRWQTRELRSKINLVGPTIALYDICQFAY